MKASPGKFESDLKAGRRQPVYLLHGQEAFLVEAALERLLRALVEPEAGDFNLEIKAAVDLQPAELHGLLAQLPMFGGRRVVVIKHLEELNGKIRTAWLDGAAEAVAGVGPQSHLVLVAHQRLDARTRFYKAVDQAGLAVEFGPLREAEIMAWLDGRARAAGKEIEAEARELLLAKVGPSLGDLAQELDKLCLFAGQARVIGPAEVRAASASLRGYTNFDLADAMVGRDGLKAMIILDDLLAAGGREAGPLIVGALAHRLRTLFRARSLLDQGLSKSEAAQALPGRPYFARQEVEQAQGWESARLARAILRLHQADLNLKQGAPLRETLEAFVLWFCG